MTVFPGVDTIVCNDLNYQLRTLVNGIEGGSKYSYTWSNGEKTSRLTPFVEGSYSVSVGNTGCGTISSNEVIVDFFFPFEDEQICAVSYDALSGKPVVQWGKTEGVNTSGYIVYRSTPFGTYEQIDFVDFDSQHSVDDHNAPVGLYDFHYRVVSVDLCGSKSTKSQSHTPMTLSLNCTGTTTSITPSPYLIDGEQPVGIAYTLLRGTTSSNMIAFSQLSGMNAIVDGDVSTTYFYALTATLPGSCKDVLYSNTVSNAACVESKTGLQGIDGGELSISPNPCEDVVTISFPETNQPATLIVVGAKGELITRINNITGNSISLNCKSLTPGTYFVRVEAEKVFEGKVVKR